MANNPKRPGITEAHVRVSLALLNSPAYIALGYSARALFMDLRSKLRSTKNGNVNSALTELKHRGWSHPATLAKALRQLEAVGLLRKTRQTVGVEHGSKICNLFRFTDVECWEHPKLGVPASNATHDYKQFTTLGDARRAVKQASQGKKRSKPATQEKQRSIQKVKRDATEIEASLAFDATEIEVTPPDPTSKSEASKRSADPPES